MQTLQVRLDQDCRQGCVLLVVRLLEPTQGRVVVPEPDANDGEVNRRDLLLRCLQQFLKNLFWPPTSHHPAPGRVRARGRCIPFATPAGEAVIWWATIFPASDGPGGISAATDPECD